MLIEELKKYLDLVSGQNSVFIHTVTSGNRRLLMSDISINRNGNIIIDTEYEPKEIETIKDPVTGLVWEKRGSEKIMLWKEVQEYVKSLGKGWRVPTRKELYSLISDERKDPCLRQDLLNLGMSCSSSGYWAFIPNTGDAWSVSFDDGYVSYSYTTNSYNSYYVRCVKNPA